MSRARYGLSASRLLLFIACGLALSLGLVACDGGSRDAAAIRTPFSSTSIELALQRRLTGEGLSYQWVRCLPTSHFYQRTRLFRCNVDFGDPHIEPYCATLIGHSLLTDHRDRRLDCGQRMRHDELHGHV